MADLGLDFAKSCGIIPVVIQDYFSKDVLMLGYMNSEAFYLTLETGFVHYFSRSKNRIWKKGETSSHVQEVKEIRLDCDNDTLLIKVIQRGDAACHEGYRSCFFRKLEKDDWVVDSERIFNPEDVYKE